MRPPTPLLSPALMPSGLAHQQSPTHLLPQKPEPALPCCLGKVQGPLSGVLQPVRDKASSTNLMIVGSALPCAVAGEGQGQLSCSYDPRASSLVCHKWQGAGVGQGITPLLTLQHGRQVEGPVVPHSHPQGWLAHTPATRASSGVLPRQDEGPTLLSATEGERQDQVSFSYDSRAKSPTCRTGKGRGERYLSLIHTTTLETSGRARSPMLIFSGLTHPKLPKCVGPTLPSIDAS